MMILRRGESYGMGDWQDLQPIFLNNGKRERRKAGVFLFLSLSGRDVLY
jgi:hypothetical protein